MNRTRGSSRARSEGLSSRGQFAAQGFFLAAHGLHGLHGFLAAHGLHGLQAFLAAHGLHGLQAFLAAHGLHGLQLAATLMTWPAVFEDWQGFFFLAAHGLHGLHGFFLAAHGLHGLQAFLAAHGLHGLQGFLAEQGLQLPANAYPASSVIVLVTTAPPAARPITSGMIAAVESNLDLLDFIFLLPSN